MRLFLLGTILAITGLFIDSAFGEETNIQLFSKPSSLLQSELAQHSLIGDPFIHVITYDIQGDTASELREEMNQKGPVGLGGIRRDAYTSWYISWKWPYKQNGKPEFEKTKAYFQINLTVPDWNFTPNADSALVEKWSRYLQKLVLHEKQHVLFASENYLEIEKSIQGAAKSNPSLTISEANQAGHHVLDQIRKLDKAYDRRTNHGESQGAVFSGS